MRQRRWLELLADYDCEIRYHPGKVWISQKSQENSQKRASTDTRFRRVQKEAKEAEASVKSQSNIVKPIMDLTKFELLEGDLNLEEIPRTLL
ncbi:hypothetical protein Tco_0667944 [Tanacetum coccineum]